jgi:hypothetical protein
VSGLSLTTISGIREPQIRQELETKKSYLEKKIFPLFTDFVLLLLGQKRIQKLFFATDEI